MRTENLLQEFPAESTVWDSVLFVLQGYSKSQRKYEQQKNTNICLSYKSLVFNKLRVQSMLLSEHGNIQDDPSSASRYDFSKKLFNMMPDIELRYFFVLVGYSLDKY